MPAFSYEVLDAQGQTRKGTLEADNARAARSQLRSQRALPRTRRATHRHDANPRHRGGQYLRTYRVQQRSISCDHHTTLLHACQSLSWIGYRTDAPLE